MDALIKTGVDWIVAIQSLGSWLELPMLFFTVLGNENFFFLVLPLLYWCVDTALGLRIAFILVTSNYLNSILKLVFAAPRPFWVSKQVMPFLHEDTFGIPSGHAQNAAAFTGVAAAWVGKSWAWVIVLLLTFFIGFSRLYLGVHFVHDVLAGWALGMLRTAIERTGVDVPAWVVRWERWVGLSPIERAFESVNFALRNLDQAVPVHSTPVERAAKLTRILPAKADEIKVLLDEHQTSLYTSRIADVTQARRAAFDLRKQVVVERIRYLFLGKPNR